MAMCFRHPPTRTRPVTLIGHRSRGLVRKCSAKSPRMSVFEISDWKYASEPWTHCLSRKSFFTSGQTIIRHWFILSRNGHVVSFSNARADASRKPRLWYENTTKSSRIWNYSWNFWQHDNEFEIIVFVFNVFWSAGLRPNALQKVHDFQYAGCITVMCSTNEWSTNLWSYFQNVSDLERYVPNRHEIASKFIIRAGAPTHKVKLRANLWDKWNQNLCNHMSAGQYMTESQYAADGLRHCHQIVMIYNQITNHSK
jgi:hypothetical protein